MSKDGNIAAQKSLSENVNAGNLEAAMQSFAPNAVDHDPAPGQAPGRDGFTAFFTELLTAFPDAKIEPQKAIADEDHVAVAYTLTGTHQGDFNGIPATGKNIEVRGMQLSRFENEQIVERWGSSDELGVMHQIGADVSPKSGLAKLADRLGS